VLPEGAYLGAESAKGRAMTLMLSEWRVAQKDDQPDRFSVVRKDGGGGDSYKFRAEGEDECDQWLHALSAKP
jgi:hypothetical protein